jgi:hypothetical protein
MNEAMEYIWENYKRKVNKDEKKKPKAFTVPEYRDFIFLVLKGRLHVANGVENLFDGVKDGDQEPANLGVYMREHRFKQYKTFVPWAFANLQPMLKLMDEINKELPEGHYYIPGDVGMEHHRHTNIARRKRKLASCKQTILDEKGFRHNPQVHQKEFSKDGGAPKLWLEERKPWKFGPMWRNMVDVDTGVEIWYECCDHPINMAKMEFSDRWTADTAMVLRAMKAAGATKENAIHWDGDALFCAGMEIFEAIDEHFPGSTASGIIKNKHAGTPSLELRAAAKSWDGRIRKPGFEMYAETNTSKGTPVMMVVSLYSEDGTNVLISSSGTNCPSTQLYAREWVDPVTRKKTVKQVERCEAIVEYFNDSGTIDEVNRKVIGEILLIDSWQGIQYWWKVFLRDTSACVADMYNHMKIQGELHLRRTKRVETVVELLNRLVGVFFTAEKKIFAKQVVDVTTPKSKERHSRTVGPDRRHLTDGEHVAAQGKFVPKKVQAGVRKGEEYMDPLKRPCLVCKARGTKVGKVRPRCPQTANRDYLCLLQRVCARPNCNTAVPKLLGCPPSPQICGACE